MLLGVIPSNIGRVAELLSEYMKIGPHAGPYCPGSSKPSGPICFMKLQAPNHALSIIEKPNL